MAQMIGDTAAITRLGSSIKNLGYAQLVVFIASIFIGIAMAGSIIGIATRSGSIEEFILDFKDTLRVYLIILLLLSLVGTFFMYRLYQSLKFVHEDTEFASPLIDLAAKLFAAVIFLQIIGIFVGLYFINLITQELEELALNDPTVEGFETFANDLRASGEVIVTSIMAIGISLMMLGAFNSIKDWTSELHGTTGNFWFSEARNKLGNVSIGIMILIAGQVFNLITLGAFGDFFQFIGVVVLMVSYVQVGNRLVNVPYINDGVAMTQYSSYQADSQQIKQPLVSNQPSSVEIYCTNCGYSNHIGSRFCNSCGEKLI